MRGGGGGRSPRGLGRQPLLTSQSAAAPPGKRPFSEEPGPSRGRLGSCPGGQRPERSDIKQAGDRMTFSRAGASKRDLPAGPARPASVLAYIVPGVCCARCSPGHTCTERSRSPTDLPFSLKGKQKRWTSLEVRLGAPPLSPLKKALGRLLWATFRPVLTHRF